MMAALLMRRRIIHFMSLGVVIYQPLNSQAWIGLLPMKTSCQICGKEIDRPPAHLARAKKGIFCSHACHGKWQTGENNHAYQGGKVELHCKYCGKVFFRKQGESMRENANYCSHSCSSKVNTVNQPLNLYADCAYCGKQVKVRFRKQLEREIFCTRNCANIAHSKKMKGIGNPRYVHGMAWERYPREFRILAPLVRQRDSQQCQLCQMTAEQNGKELDVHHIDYDKEHNEPLNLITLCRWCHGKMHGSPDSRKKWQQQLSTLLSQ